MMKQDWIKKYLSEEDLAAILNEIAEVEKFTSGQIRLSLRHKRHPFERLTKPHKIAIRDFHRLGMQNTKHKTGVLIFILFGEKYYDILADSGIHKKIPDEVWKSIEEKIKGEFRNGNYKNAILHIIEKVGEVLREEFPRGPGSKNELTSDISIE